MLKSYSMKVYSENSIAKQNAIYQKITSLTKNFPKELPVFFSKIY